MTAMIGRFIQKTITFMIINEVKATERKIIP